MSGMQALQDIKEVQRRQSPGKRPQPLAFHDGRLWLGSWETDKLYAVDPQTWAVLKEVPAPGKPFGIASFGGSLYVVVALDDDDRYLFRFDPAQGFDLTSKTACPDFTGSHLAAAGGKLYLCQQGKQRILVIDTKATVEREIALPTRCGGFNFGPGGEPFMISADEEFESLAFARIDLRESKPSAEVIAGVPFDARGLAFDGTAWWSCEREASEIVSFTV
ncbi:MAG: hypothetical protein WAK16_12350 [Candidatus Cybelea sp.]